MCRCQPQILGTCIVRRLWATNTPIVHTTDAPSSPLPLASPILLGPNLMALVILGKMLTLVAS